MRICLLLALALPCGYAQTQTLTEGPHRMEIMLDRLDSGTWSQVDPGLVFNRDDRLRFRYRTNFDGYLYVMNWSTSGHYEQLFPSADAGEDNRVKAGAEYTVPATKSAFRIAGPAGHELVYWLVSPAQIKPSLPPPEKHRPEDLLPRCDDEIFKARGDCVDSSAGLKGVVQGEKLPGNLAASGAVTPRDLLFMRKDKTTVVGSPVPLTGPVVYEFRLAHK
jgi:hypothetical protein